MRFLYLVFAIVGCSLINANRLPKNVIPWRYHLTMEPVLSGTTAGQRPFHGSVVIELEAVHNTSTVTLHSDNIQLISSSISIKDVNGRAISITRTSSDDETNTYTLHLRLILEKGARYNLTIDKFSGTLGTGEGFFLGEHYTNRTKRLMAGTHFQPKGARKAFPCFDEPSFKAKFIISLIRTSEFYSLSNQELERTERLPNGRFKDIYKETPVMSTYILAFAVLNFGSPRSLERHRVYAPSDVIGAVDIPLKAAVSILAWFEKYTEVAYVLNKIDHLVVPDNFIVDNAMENWGLIVYQQRHFKYTNNMNVMKRVLTYEAHELAHQWFGNLITPDNFDYLWLSESIAAYFQHYAASFVEPTWRLMDQFVIDNVHNGFFKEESKGAHPLNYDLQESQKFPPFHILYEKGSSIFRMMKHFLSEEVFQQALHRYLIKNQYKNVVPSDLYNACQEAFDGATTRTNLGGMTVAKIMSSWDSNPGYPAVTVTRNYQTGLVTLKQQSGIENGTKSFWNIPINYVQSINPSFAKTSPELWLTKSSETIQELPVSGWLIVNAQQTGHYRVNYDLENWNRIINFLRNGNIEQIHVLNRAQMINDAFYFAYREVIPVSIPLTLCEYLVREKDYIPFASFFNSISNYLYIYVGLESKQESEFLRKHSLAAGVPPSKPTDYSREYKIFQKYIRYIMTNIRNSLGLVDRPQDTFIEKLFRAEIDKYFPYYF